MTDIDQAGLNKRYISRDRLDAQRYISRDRLDARGIRRTLGRLDWPGPPSGLGLPNNAQTFYLAPYGDDCWQFTSKDCIIMSGWKEDDDVEWVHASISRLNQEMATYDDLKNMHKAVFKDGFAYQCFVPPESHVNIVGHVLHLWGRMDGSAALPDFGRFGTI